MNTITVTERMRAQAPCVKRSSLTTERRSVRVSIDRHHYQHDKFFHGLVAGLVPQFQLETMYLPTTPRAASRVPLPEEQATSTLRTKNAPDDTVRAAPDGTPHVAPAACSRAFSNDKSRDVRTLDTDIHPVVPGPTGHDFLFNSLLRNGSVCVL